MLRSIRKIIGYRIHSVDGEFGAVDDFYFDDHAWYVRYVVVDMHRWLPGRRTLVSPVELGEPDWRRKILPVKLTRERIENAPDFDTVRPVSRQNEIELAQYYGWAAYWEPDNPLGARGEMLEKAAYGIGAPHLRAAEETVRQQVIGEEVAVRSVKEVKGYHIHATDEEIGRVADFIVDTSQWRIRYLVVDTGAWLPGRKVLISPAWATRVDWGDGLVFVDLTRDQIKGSPEFDPAQPVNRRYENELYDYYGRPVEW